MTTVTWRMTVPSSVPGGHFLSAETSCLCWQMDEVSIEIEQRVTVLAGADFGDLADENIVGADKEAIDQPANEGDDGVGVGAGIKFQRFATIWLRSEIARLIQHAAQA